MQSRRRARLRHRRARRRTRRRSSPALDLQAYIASSRSGCARPRPTSSSRRRPACATRSAGSRTASSGILSQRQAPAVAGGQRGSRRVAVEPTSARPPRPRAAPAAAPAPEPGRLPYGGAWLGPRARAYLRLLDHRLARLRALLRADELALVALAALVGAGAGVAVAVMSRATQLVHELLFADCARGRASRPAPASRPGASSPFPSSAACCSASSVAERPLPLARRWSTRSRPTRSTAAGMSLLDSLGVGLETLISNGAGASVGLEAGYTQVGSGLASRLGDIASACAATTCASWSAAARPAPSAPRSTRPLTGAFYAFELVIGGYTVAGARAGRRAARSPAPRWPSSLAAHSTSDRDRHQHRPDLARPAPVPGPRRPAALAGIALMLGVTWTERAFRGLHVPRGAAAGARGRRGRRPRPALPAGALLRPRRALRPARSRRSRSGARPASCCASRWPRRSRSAPASAAACSSPRCSWAPCSAPFRRHRRRRCARPAPRPARLRAHRHGQHGGRRRRRPADDGLPGARDHRRLRAGAGR